MEKPGLLTAVDASYASALDPECSPQAHDHIAQHTGGRGAAIVPLAAGDRLAAIASPSLEQPTRDYSREWWRHDVRDQRRSVLGITAGLVTDADLLDEGTPRTHPFFQQFLRPHRLGAQLGYVTVVPSRQIVALGVYRDLRRGPFKKAEVDAFAHLAAHAARAIMAASEISEGRRASRALGGALDQLAYGVILLNTRGRIAPLNDAAWSMLRAGLHLAGRRRQAAAARHQAASGGIGCPGGLRPARPQHPDAAVAAACPKDVSQSGHAPRLRNWRNGGPPREEQCSSAVTARPPLGERPCRPAARRRPEAPPLWIGDRAS